MTFKDILPQFYGRNLSEVSSIIREDLSDEEIVTIGREIAAKGQGEAIIFDFLLKTHTKEELIAKLPPSELFDLLKNSCLTHGEYYMINYRDRYIEDFELSTLASMCLRYASVMSMYVYSYIRAQEER